MDNKMPGQEMPTWLIVTLVIVFTLFFAWVALAALNPSG